jgi:hypothetical protein
LEVAMVHLKEVDLHVSTADKAALAVPFAYRQEVVVLDQVVKYS